METNKLIKGILGLSETSAAKNTLTALFIEGRPLTTASLNSILNLQKTYENYTVLLQDVINEGLVSVVDAKDYRGVTRHHFVLNLEKIIDLIEE